MKKSTFYFAGDLFDSKHLAGNAFLAEAIYEESGKSLLPVLPQNLEQRETSAHSIRDNDILCLLDCDLALFHFDGSELDSGTVVEFMFAKFADVPSVVIRSDFRAKGDQELHPWNLMVSYYPRTEVVLLDSMHIYQNAFRPEENEGPEDYLESGLSGRRTRAMLADIAGRIVEAFGIVSAQPPILPPEQAETIYDWLARMPGFVGGHDAQLVRIEEALRRKVEKGIL
ncbi:MAG: nucleoside 2-deoxyribosyltransferase [Verrucomicrobiota bacterium]